MEFEKKSDSGDTRPASCAEEKTATRELRSEEIFCGSKTVVITHAGAQYRLLITRNNKLILHK